MIKALIFDLGGVVVDWDDDIIFRHVAKRFELNYKRTKRKLYKLMSLLELNAIKEKHMWRTFFKSVKLPLPSDYKNLLRKDFERKAKLNQPIVKIIKQLRNRGYKIATISNVDKSHEAIMKKRKWLNHFDAAILSNKFGVRKPSRKIYRIVLKRLKFKPEEVIFIDNLKKNTEGAKGVGINAILFKNAKQLKKELKKLGVII